MLLSLTLTWYKNHLSNIPDKGLHPGLCFNNSSPHPFIHFISPIHEAVYCAIEILLEIYLPIWSKDQMVRMVKMQSGTTLWRKIYHI